jgi:hypothetical protein
MLMPTGGLAINNRKKSSFCCGLFHGAHKPSESKHMPTLACRPRFAGIVTRVPATLS